MYERINWNDSTFKCCNCFPCNNFRIFGGYVNLYAWLSIAEINNVLTTIGYTQKGGSSGCSTTKYGSNAELKEFDGYRVCIYEISDTDKKKGRYFRYKVVTYANIDIPIMSQTFKIPIVATSDRIFDFND